MLFLQLSRGGCGQPSMNSGFHSSLSSICQTAQNGPQNQPIIRHAKICTNIHKGTYTHAHSSLAVAQRLAPNLPCPCPHPCIRACLYSRVHARAHVRHACVCACARRCARARLCGYVRACVHACMCACVHGCVDACVRRCVRGGTLPRTAVVLSESSHSRSSTLS